MANTEFQPSLQHTAVEINASSQGKVTTGASFERGKETSPTILWTPMITSTRRTE